MKIIRHNSLLQFSVISFVVLTGIAATLAFTISTKVRAYAVGHLINDALAISTESLVREITPSDLEVPMTGERYDQFDEFVNKFIVSEEIAQVKLWSKDGTIIYSRDPETVGEKFPDKENLLTALRGETPFEINIPEGHDNAREMELGALIEVYTPIVFPGTASPAGVFEIYQYYQPTSYLIGKLRKWVIGSIVGGFLVIYILLVLTIWGGWQKVSGQRQRLLAVYTDLEEKVEKRTSELLIANEKQQRLAIESEALARIGRDIGSSLSIDNMYLGFAEGVRGILPFDRIVINSVNLKDNTFTNQYVSGADVQGRRIGEAVSLVGTQAAETVARCTGHLFEPVDRDEVADRFPGLLSSFDAGLRSFLSLPLMLRNNVIGTLNLRSAETNAYSDEDKALTEKLAEQISGSVANSQLHAMVEHDGHERAVLAEMGRITSSSLNTTDMYEQVAEQLSRLISYDSVGINILDIERGTSIAEYRKGIEVPGWRTGDEFALAGTTVEEILLTRVGMLVRGAKLDDAEVIYPNFQASIDAGHKSIIIVPLISKGLVIGTLSLSSAIPDAYSERDVELVERVGAQVAGAIERNRTEEALRKQTTIIESIINSMGEGVVVVDRNGEPLLFNPAAEQIVGIGVTNAEPDEGTETYGSFLVDKMTPLAADEQPLVRALRGEHVHQEEFFLRNQHRPEGRFVSATATPIMGEAGNLEGSVAIFSDITERKQIEESLKIAKEAAESSSITKSQFLANMSHEIRTPLHGIVGMLRLLNATKLSSKQLSYLDMMKTASDSLMGVINDILDISKIEAGKLELEPLNFKLRDLIRSTTDVMGIRAEEKRLELTSSLESELPDTVVGDPNRLRQIIVNLVGNAIKFTDSGFVRLWGAVESRSEHEVLCHFVVSDTGIGIPLEKQEGIFQEFSQADTTTTRKYGGTGLGLAISAKLVEMMGGRIWLESEEGRGSKFHFTVRLGSHSATTTTAMWSTDMEQSLSDSWKHKRPLNILLAEDNRINQALAVMVLEDWGHHVVVANNGNETLALLEKEQADIVLMDVQMPRMDGIDATKAIRDKEKGTNTHIPIIAMTANAMTGDRERFLTAGMDDYIAKPINEKVLFEMLESFSDSETEGQVDTHLGQATDDVADLDAALVMLGGKKRRLNALASMFFEESPEYMSGLEEAAESRDVDLLRHAAHKIKGAVGIFAAKRASELAQRLEEMGRDGDLTDVEEVYTALKAEMERLNIRLSSLLELNTSTKS